MTPKERAAMQQALEALVWETGSAPELIDKKTMGAITALREALDNSLKPKCFADYQPNHAIDRACAYCAVAAVCQTGEQAEQEPVAWRWPTHNGYAYAETHFDGEGGEPLYAAPVRTKDLTDDEIDRIWLKMPEKDEFEDVHWFARAVIAADREKNK